MNQIETRITGLVRWVQAEGAYCCRLEGVIDLVEKPTTVRVTMRCKYHNTYSFDVGYGVSGGDGQEDDNSVLTRRIAFEIVENISKDH